MSQSEADVLAQLRKWDPMKDDYANADFNKYTSGLGAELGSKGITPQNSMDTQSPHQGKQDERPLLIFKNVPKDMTINGLKNLCMNHGKVSSVRTSKKNAFHFVNFETINDMERVFTAFQENKYGFKVAIGNGCSTALEDKNTNNYHPLPANKSSMRNTIDQDNRTYKYPSNNRPRPHFQKSPIVRPSDYDSKGNLFKKNDPKKHFFVEGDAHDLDRLTSVKFEGNISQKYQSGRLMKEMPEKTKNLILEKLQKCAKNSGNESIYKNRSYESVLPNLGKCDECGCLCDSVCSRCNTYFCGLECQKNAWSQHRHVCGGIKPLPVSQPPPQSAFEVKIDLKKPEIEKERFPRNRNIVTITCVNKSNVVFIRSKTFDDNLEFFKVISEVQKIAKNAKPLTSPPICGQIVIAQFGEQFNRAMVLKQSNIEKINIIYIDYGNLDVKPMDKLLTAPNEFVDLPRLAFPVVLKNVPDVYMTEELRKFMLSHVDTVDMQIKYNETDYNIEKGIYKVELINDANYKSYNEAIIELAAATYPSDGTIVYREFLKHMPLPVGSNIKLVVMDNSLMCTGYISCSTDYYAHEIQKFQPQLQKYCENEDKLGYTPRVDELCIAKYGVDNKWYRGRCMEIVGDGYPTIIFFDYGNIAPISIADIRRYPTQYCFPVFTVDCQIAGLPDEVSEEVVKRLEDLIPHGKVLECDLVEESKEDNFYVITLKTVVNQLKLEGLI